MAEPKTEIERRLDRIERAIRVLASHTYSREFIETILRGEDKGETEDATSG
jgi:hypothetical protein